MEKSTQINYKKIYEDIIKKKFPDKMESLRSTLDKNQLSVLDIIELNVKIFGKPDKSSEAVNQRLRSYNKSDIFKILEYQMKNKLNNTQVAKHFKLSRNTVAYWKKMYYSKMPESSR